MGTPLPNPIVRDFWVRPGDQIDADLALLRSTAPVTFLPEEVIPESPIPAGPGYWAVTRAAEIVEMSGEPEIYSSAAGITMLDAPPEFTAFFSSMIAMDDPRHARLRRIVSAGFTPRMLAKLDDTVQEVATQIVGELDPSKPIDFVVDVAAALPLRIVCDLMGIPESEYRFVFDQTNVILGASDPEYVPDDASILGALLTAGQNLADLMGSVAKTKAGGDGTDLTSVLINAELEEDRLEAADLASFFILLTVAGNETTRNAIAWGLWYLTQQPDQRAIWAADFEGVAQTAVEEIVRLSSPVTYMRRTATRDTVLGDQQIGEGDKLAMFYISANRDESVHDDPHRFDVTRQPSHHIGFGAPGPHFCLGAHLARREITVMFRELFATYPDVHATSAPDLLRSSFIHGVKHLEAELV